MTLQRISKQFWAGFAPRMVNFGDLLNNATQRSSRVCLFTDHFTVTRLHELVQRVRNVSLRLQSQARILRRHSVTHWPLLPNFHPLLQFPVIASTRTCDPPCHHLAICPTLLSSPYPRSSSARLMSHESPWKA